MPKKTKKQEILTADQVREIMAEFPVEFLYDEQGDPIEELVLPFCRDDYHPGDLKKFYSEEANEDVPYEQLQEDEKAAVSKELIYLRDKVYPSWKKHMDKQREAYERDLEEREKLEQRILICLSGLKLKKASNWQGAWTEMSGKLLMDFTETRAKSLGSMLDEELTAELHDPESGDKIGSVTLTLKNAESKFAGGMHKIQTTVTLKPKADEVAMLMGIDGKNVLAQIRPRQLSFEEFATPFNRYALGL